MALGEDTPASQRSGWKFSRKEIHKRLGPSHPLYHIYLDSAIQDMYAPPLLNDHFTVLNTAVWNVDADNVSTDFALASGVVSGQLTGQVHTTDNAWIRLEQINKTLDVAHRPVALGAIKASAFDQFITTTDTTADTAAAVTASDLTILLDDASQVAVDEIIAIDSEFMKVRIVNTSTNYIDVDRGVYETTVAAHTSSTSIYDVEAGTKLKIEFGLTSEIGDTDNDGPSETAGQVNLKATPTSKSAITDYGVVILDTDDNRYWDVIADNGGTPLTSNVATGPWWDGADDEWQTVMIAMNENEETYGWINGTPIGTVVATAPSTGSPLGVEILCQNREGATRDYELDYVKVWQERVAIS